MTTEKLMEIYDLLYERFGSQHWWPGDGQFEIIIGAILTQNTNWTNVEKAITNLKKGNALYPEKLYEMEKAKIAELIKPAGYFNVKAKRLKGFMNWFVDNYQGKIENLQIIDTRSLRQELLSISGIGHETADSILLYALERPMFVVDTYTARVAVRHNLIEDAFDYIQLQSIFQENLLEDVQLFNEYHALIVRCGKEYCRPKAKCVGCPLEILPHTLEYEEQE